MCPALCCLIGASLNSCMELDDSVYTTIVSDKYHYTEKDMVAILGNAYTPWRSVVIGAINETQTISTDETMIPVHPWGWNGTTINMHLHTWTSETGEAVNRWGDLYTGINNANQVIYQIESGLLPVTEGKDNYLAELKAVRASYYYMLCDYYGNVPYLTRFDVPQGFLPEQISRKALNDSIIAEVTAALPLLPENVDKSTYGRFTKWAAYALLAKMYINAEVYTGTPQWQKCLDACEEIIKSGKFSLAGNQKDVFKADNEDCTEAIFAVPFDQSYAGGLNIFNYALNGQFSQVYSTKSFGGWGGSVAVPQFINGLNIAGVTINRKMLSEIAIDSEEAFSDLVKVAKDALNGNLKEEKVVKTSTKKETTKKEAKKEETKDLSKLTVAELKEMAKAKKIEGISSMKKADLINALK